MRSAADRILKEVVDAHNKYLGRITKNGMRDAVGDSRLSRTNRNGVQQSEYSYVDMVRTAQDI